MDQFYEIFFHDALLKEVSIKSTNENERKVVEFVIQTDDSNLLKCIFTKVSELHIEQDLRNIGYEFVSTANISEDDNLISVYREKYKSFLSACELDKIKCYTIITSKGGIIKILSESSFEVIKMSPCSP